MRALLPLLLLAALISLLPLAAEAGGVDTALEHGDDADDDGWPDSVDCAPEDPEVYPDAPEACDDGLDNDCDGDADGADDDCGGAGCGGGAAALLLLPLLGAGRRAAR